jgi:hypothetical protein
VPDPFLKLRNCGCLSCQVILLILDQQRESRQTSWSAPEVLNALAEASAFFLNELYAHHGPAAVGVEEHLHALDGMSVVLTGWSALTLARMS